MSETRRRDPGPAAGSGTRKDGDRDGRRDFRAGLHRAAACSRLAVVVVVLLAPSLAAASEPEDLPWLPCTYVRAAVSADDTPELEPHGECARVSEDGVVRISPEHLAAAAYSDGLAAFWVAGRWFYARPDGRLLHVLTFDNGPDSWSEGLVRSPEGEGIAFHDRSFERIIPPRYDWAWPFEDGRALVCVGCEPVAEDSGEHRAIRGGRWGWIGPTGEEIVPVSLSREEALEEGRRR